MNSFMNYEVQLILGYRTIGLLYLFNQPMELGRSRKTPACVHTTSYRNTDTSSCHSSMFPELQSKPPRAIGMNDASGTEHIKSDNTITRLLYGLCLIWADGEREQLAMTHRQPNQHRSQAGRTKSCSRRKMWHRALKNTFTSTKNAKGTQNLASVFKLGALGFRLFLLF